MLSKESPYIASAYQQLQVISQDADKRAEYDTRLKAQLDYNQGLKEAEERGVAKGIKQLLQTMLESKPIEEVAVAVKMSVEDVKGILRQDV